MISVLCPTRGRPESLERSLTGLLELADDRNSLELLVACDPDEETSTLAVGQAVASQGRARVRVWSAPERYGYQRLQEYYNYLASLARGEWLLLWNDDAFMQTRGWDTIIGSHAPAILWLQANHSDCGNLFPAWPKAWTDAVGYISLSPHVDTWLQEIGNRLKRMDRVPVTVFHDRKDVTGGHDDKTYAEGRALVGSDLCVPEHDSPANATAREWAMSVIHNKFLAQPG